MAKFSNVVPTELINAFSELEYNCEDMLGEMCEIAGKAVYKLVQSNMKRSFKSTDSLDRGLKMTKVYKSHKSSEGETGVKIAFYGYIPNSPKTKRFPKGTPIPLVAMAREYGTSQGERKKPFFRKAFKRELIVSEMERVQEKYLPKE